MTRSSVASTAGVTVSAPLAETLVELTGKIAWLGIAPEALVGSRLLCKVIVVKGPVVHVLVGNGECIAIPIAHVQSATYGETIESVWGETSPAVRMPDAPRPASERPAAR